MRDSFKCARLMRDEDDEMCARTPSILFLQKHHRSEFSHFPMVHVSFHTLLILLCWNLWHDNGRAGFSPWKRDEGKQFGRYLVVDRKRSPDWAATAWDPVGSCLHSPHELWKGNKPPMKTLPESDHHGSTYHVLKWWSRPQTRFENLTKNGLMNMKIKKWSSHRFVCHNVATRFMTCRLVVTSHLFRSIL